MYRPLIKENNFKWFRYSIIIINFLNLLTNLVILIIFIYFILTLENKINNINLSSIKNFSSIFENLHIDDIKYLIDKINKNNVEQFFQDIETCVISKCYLN